jgi:hypothetical protein
MYRSFRSGLLFVLAATALLAQTEKATVRGTVTDGTGAVVPDAVITVSDTATNLDRKTTSDSKYLYAHFYFRRNIEAPLTDVGPPTDWLAARTAEANTTVMSTLAVFRGNLSRSSVLRRSSFVPEVQYMPRSLGTLELVGARQQPQKSIRP